MINQVPTITTPSYMAKPADAFYNTPVIEKFGDEKQRAKRSLLVLGGGAAVAPVLGMGLERITGPNGLWLKWAESINNKPLAQRFDIWLKGLKLGDKVNNLLSPIKSKFNPDNVKLFKEGFSSGSMASVAKDTILNAEKATAAIAEATKGAVDPSVMENLTKTAAEAVKKVPAAKETLASLEKVSKMGVLGKTFGKAGLFLRKNLTGLTGIFNGLFAAMTINGVIQAKKGEKVSTLMEDLLGTWIGSLGGFRLFDAALKGLAKVNAASTASGILPTIAKVVNKIPAKGFLIPLAGAMILSNVLQKVSHKIFGKPTKNDPKVIESAEDFQKWRQQTGWTQEEFNAARQVS